MTHRLGWWLSVLIFAGTIDHCDKMTYNCIISYQDFVYIFIFTCISNFIIVFYYNCTYLSDVPTRNRPNNKFSPHPSKQDLENLFAQPNRIEAIHDYLCKIIQPLTVGLIRSSSADFRWSVLCWRSSTAI